MKRQRVLLLSILAVLSSLVPSLSDAAAAALPVNPSAATAITIHGVRLSLSLPPGPYARDALVRVHLTLTNVSNHSIAIGGTSAPECAWKGPGVEVLGPTGQVLYPPATDWLLASCGGPIFPQPLAPGRELHHTTLAILRGSAIRAVATLSTTTRIETPLLHLHLIDEAAPTLTVQRNPELRLLVTPATEEQQGAFFFVFGILCPGGNPPSLAGGYGTGVPRWQRTLTRAGRAFHFDAQCANPVRWVFAGGWLNHPIATLDYTGSG